MKFVMFAPFLLPPVAQKDEKKEREMISQLRKFCDVKKLFLVQEFSNEKGIFDFWEEVIGVWSSLIILELFAYSSV